MRSIGQVNDHRLMSYALPAMAGKSPLEYCAQMIETLLLNLQVGLERPLGKATPDIAGLSQIQRDGARALAGLSLCRALRGQTDASLTETLLLRVQAFQENLSGLS